MQINIRPATKKDMPDVLLLIKELAAFEKEPDAVIVTTEDLIRDGFGENKLFTCYVAELNGVVEGMALFYFRYSTWKGKTVHLEDLMVRDQHRKKGLGIALYKKVMQYAIDNGVKRVEWVVLDWNTGAIDFYEKTGAKVHTNWNTVQFDEKAIKEFLNQN